MSNLGQHKTPINNSIYNAMERTITQDKRLNALNAVSYESAVAEFEKEAQTEELSCSLLLKNLLLTNLRLLKLNEISTVLLF